MQGVGMTLAGACPGMTFAQLGAGVATAPVTYLGGLCGASVYSLLHPWLKEHHICDYKATLDGKVDSMHLERVFFNGKFIPIAASLGVLTLSTALGLELLFPWKTEARATPGLDENHVMNPTLAGLILGALQIPIFLFLGSFLGASSGYSVVTSQVLHIMPKHSSESFTYAKSFMKSTSIWQVGFGMGIVIGAGLASGFWSQSIKTLIEQNSFPAAPVHSVPKYEAFIGGMLTVFSARFVGGCASGHGLTGLPALHIISWLTIPATFVGAILTGHIMSNFVAPRTVYLLQI